MSPPPDCLSPRQCAARCSRGCPTGSKGTKWPSAQAMITRCQSESRSRTTQGTALKQAKQSKAKHSVYWCLCPCQWNWQRTWRRPSRPGSRHCNRLPTRLCHGGLGPGKHPLVPLLPWQVEQPLGPLPFSTVTQWKLTAGYLSMRLCAGRRDHKESLKTAPPPPQDRGTLRRFWNMQRTLQNNDATGRLPVAPPPGRRSGWQALVAVSQEHDPVVPEFHGSMSSHSHDSGAASPRRWTLASSVTMNMRHRPRAVKIAATNAQIQ
jgi:hypothetical protein